MRWFWLFLAVVLLILVPFFLFEEFFTALAERAVGGGISRPMAIAIIGGLLALDVVLPVPSSLVSAAAGVLLGFWGGMVVIWVGMTVSCVVAYVIGAKSSRLGRRLVGPEGLARAAAIAGRYGSFALVLCRPVPVLAEASVIFAGLVGVSVGRFIAVCALSNLGIAAGYAAVGAFSMSMDSFLLAFAGALLLPAAAWLVARPWLRRVQRQG